MKIFLRTLGCKMNFLDSARIAAACQQGGHEIVEREDDAEVVIVNSCTVTSQADRKTADEAAKAANLGKEVILFGCGPRVDPEEWKKRFPHAKIFAVESELLKHFGFDPATEIDFPLSSRTRLPIAIQTGCDNTCTFCITRIARGKHENLPLESIIRQIQRAEEAGVKEIVLTGINLAAWGCTNSNRPEESKFAHLLEEILKQTSIPRIRISSIGPQFLSDAFFEIYANERICDHLHLSVQSGSPSVLQRMNRGHGIEEIRNIVQKSYSIRPETAITCDLIVGFPGETEAEFAETMALAREVGFSKLHVFPFSPREGTPAADFPNQVPEKVKKERALQLRALGEELSNQFLTSQLGKTISVLTEKDGTGLSTNFLRFATPESKGNEIISMIAQQ